MNLAVPFLWYPGQDPEEAAQEINLMLRRSLAVQQLQKGTLTDEDFCDLLSDQGYFVHDLLNIWGEGGTLI
jgi:hypothetical protein